MKCCRKYYPTSQSDIHSPFFKKKGEEGFFSKKSAQAEWANKGSSIGQTLTPTIQRNPTDKKEKKKPILFPGLNYSPDPLGLRLNPSRIPMDVSGSLKPDHNSLLVPFIVRGIRPNSRDYSNVMKHWRYSFQFFKKAGFSYKRAKSFADKSTGFTVENQLSSEFPNWVETQNRKDGAVPASIGGTILEF